MSMYSECLPIMNKRNMRAEEPFADNQRNRRHLIR